MRLSLGKYVKYYFKLELVVQNTYRVKQTWSEVDFWSKHWLKENFGKCKTCRHLAHHILHTSQYVSKRFSGACIMWAVAVITGWSIGNIWRVFLSSFMSIDWDKIDVHRAINKGPIGYLQPVCHIWKRQLILNSINEAFIIMTILNRYILYFKRNSEEKMELSNFAFCQTWKDFW